MITKEQLSRFGLVIFCSLCAIVMIDTAIWWLDGPRYTHEMWYHDRLDRINEDHKLQVQIDELKLLVSKLNIQ